MKKQMESLKSFILFFLVGLSMFLSFNIWTFKLDYETIENEKYIQKVAIGEKKATEQVVMPRGTYVHMDEKHYALGQAEEDDLFKNLKTWEIIDMKVSDKSFSYENFLQSMNEQFSLQIEFPTEISSLFLNGLFSKAQLNDLDFSFHNILLFLDPALENKVYFVNESTAQVFEGILKQNNMVDLKERLKTIDETKTPVEAFGFRENQLFYLPRNAFSLERIIFLTDQLDSEMFKDALFTNPKYVKRSGEDGNVFYTDGTRLLKENKQDASLVYVNPLNIEIKNQASQKFQLESFNYVNSHAGFTGNYYFSDVLEDNRQVVFRMYHNNLPVFGRNLCAAIQVRWGQDESLSYIHPSYQLSYQVEQEKTPILMDSGRTVYEKLTTHKNIDSNLIDNIRISYVMEREGTFGQLVYLTPTWVVLYNGKWIDLDTLIQGNGGDFNGLE